MAQQTPSQYLVQHEHLLLNISIASQADSSEMLMEVHGNGKRPNLEREKKQYILEDIETSHLYQELKKMLELWEVRERHFNLGLNGGYQAEMVDHHLTWREWPDEWKHLHHVLKWTMETFEKMSHSMAVLRCCKESGQEELNYWKRRFNENTEMRKTD
ncbi:Protein CBFA2T2 [Fukomys damarensis]|uniref:Protein CBFA2T2 n=1 Tax=Fukomys damarensis TaxID=885580 RepID=A0A091DZW4_FUKDA|nr:Protein CBFA2T2 [Fukomys damarensis]